VINDDQSNTASFLLNIQQTHGVIDKKKFTFNFIVRTIHCLFQSSNTPTCKARLSAATVARSEMKFWNFNCCENQTMNWNISFQRVFFSTSQHVANVTQRLMKEHFLGWGCSMITPDEVMNIGNVFLWQHIHQLQTGYTLYVILNSNYKTSNYSINNLPAEEQIHQELWCVYRIAGRHPIVRLH